MTPVVIPQVRLSFARYFWLAWRFTLKSQPSMWLIVLPMFPVVALLQGLLSGRIPLRDVMSGATVFPLLLLALLLSVPVQMWRTYRRAPLLSGATSYEFDDRGVQIQNEVQHTQLQWTALQRAHRFGNWLLLLSGAQAGFYIDLSRVQAPHTSASVLALLQQHGVAPS